MLRIVSLRELQYFIMHSARYRRFFNIKHCTNYFEKYYIVAKRVFFFYSLNSLQAVKNNLYIYIQTFYYFYNF